jgi:hypothetical protein
MRRKAWFTGRFSDPEATHSLRARRRTNRTPKLLLGLVTAALVVATLATFGARHRSAGIITASLGVAPPPLADEGALLAAPTDTPSLWRFSANPKIYVAIFPSLHMQAMALNRVAAFVERPDVPRNHVLTDKALMAVMGHTPTMFDTYYYGHDYRRADLNRFHDVAYLDGAELNDDERHLFSRLLKAGFLADDDAALITLPPHGDGLLDPSARATILHHELAHGAYFTDPAYAAYVEHFWTSLSEPERTAFRQFLEGEGYDSGNDDLMRNETQAYLVFTADPRMFDPNRIGVPEALSLRRRFIDGMRLDWLRKDADPQ